MKTRIIAFVLLFTLLSFTGFAQRIRVIDGSLDVLKGIKKFNVQFDYSKMGVGKFETEQEYIDKKKSDYNQKEPGSGDRWVKSWQADRKNRFEPQFKELFYKYGKINLADYPDEKYTFIFKTVYTEPGFNIYVTRKSAEIDGELLIVETANPDKVIVKLSVQNCPGRSFGGNDYDTGERLEEAYAMAGKALGKYFEKELGE